MTREVRPASSVSMACWMRRSVSLSIDDVASSRISTGGLKASARANLAELVREAEAGRSVELTRRGKSVAVLVGSEQYDRLLGRGARFSAAWDAFRAEVDVPSLEIEPEEIFAGVRDASPGRGSDLDS